MPDKPTSWIYRIIKCFVRLFSPKMKLVGELPEEPCVLVGNHCQIYGPIAGELYLPGRHYIWCAGQMMRWREVHGYAYKDFWSFKPKALRWLYKLLSYLITPLSVCVFNNAHTVPVYRDARILTTFRRSLELLEEGSSLLIFPEHNVKYNNILYDFQDKFIDLARFYHRKGGKALCFVPLYIAPALRTMVPGEPIRFDPEAPIDRERERIRAHLMAQITALAVSLPEHTVVPYRNIPRRDYPKNRPLEVYTHEESSC